MRTLLACFLFAFAMLQIAGSFIHADEYALLVAVKNYPRNQLNSLKYTENDVEQFAKVLAQSGFDPKNIHLMTQAVGAENPRFFPTAKNVMKELELLLSILDTGDTIIVAFTGHGVQFAGDATNYFCPADVNLEDRNTLISLSEVFEKLEMSKARHKVLLVDACRNDPQTEFSKSSKRIILEPVHERKPPVMEGGTAALFSCSGGEQSWEDDKLSHGVFFNYVIEGLTGKADLDGDKQITFDELKAYTRSAVKSYVFKELGEAQTPSSSTAKENIGSVAIVTLQKSLPNLLTAPFSVVVARESQQRWSDYLQTQVTIENSIGMELVLIPPGEFMMGSTDAENGLDGEKPQHRVQISQPFLLGRTEVTQKQWKSVMGTEPWKEDGKLRDYVREGDDYPATVVSWEDAAKFCNALSKRDGKQPVYRIAGENGRDTIMDRDSDGYRLPTEAEWEYACRGGTTTAFSFGNEESKLSDYAWWGGFSDDGNAKDEKYAHRVGLKRSNPFGLHDMHGNLWEWCWDWYGAYPSGSVSDPTGVDTGSFRVGRGGGWRNIPRYCRSAIRRRNDPSFRFHGLGFRVASSPFGPVK
ncbi:MAG TPA: SUMF1/EgtB/PvdO family nonheme iron enzyme [Pirellulaceae bacterium]|nr:SUMF1/EgtB/PvdO family nonheme iron enzyme [Pirellulaceae bacterium]